MMNRFFILALSFLITTFSFAQSSTVLNLELTNTTTDFMMMEVYIETSPAYIVGDEGPNPNNPIPLFIGGTTMETSLTFGENVDVFDLFITQVCSDNMGAVETTIIPPVTLSYNGELDSSGVVTMELAMELACGEGGEPLWDCPNLNANIGSSCQGGWGVVDENCDCVEYEMNCLEAAGIDVSTLLMYFIFECGNEDNLEPWYFCGLAETLTAAQAGNYEACDEIFAWIEANDWDGTWDPGNGGNDFDCPELGGNVGDWCTTNNGAFGEITLYCECVEIQDCGDFEVSTNLLSNDDGTGNGSIEAIASGGTPPYSYEWEAWAWEVIGTDAVLDNCVAGVYFVQATDFNGCVAFGNEEVLFSVDTLEWDCPNLSMNVGDPCQGGWGIIDEDCECIEDTEIGGCEALFTIDQAINEEDGEAVLFALFVYLWDYDESNEYYWSFGDEGGSSDPFPVWTYESNGPYEICLTVSNEVEECSNTYCSTIGVDSLGWDNGLQDGFTITIINGDEDSQSSINEENTLFVFEVFPNPTTGNEINMNWFGESNEKITCKLIDITGKAVSFKSWFPSSESEQLSMNIDDVNPGMYLLKMDQGSRSVTSRVIINR